MKSPSTHGGSRPPVRADDRRCRAARPPQLKRIAITVRVPVECHVEFLRQCRASNVSQSFMFAALVNIYRDL